MADKLPQISAHVPPPSDHITTYTTAQLLDYIRGNLRPDGDSFLEPHSVGPTALEYDLDLSDRTSFETPLTNAVRATSANNSAQGVTSGGGTFVINSFSSFASGTGLSASGGGMTVSVAGLYLFFAWAQPLSGSASGQTNTYICRRGVSSAVDDIIYSQSNGIAAPKSYSGVTFLPMVAGDFATIGFAQNSGVTMTMGTSNILRGVRVA